MYKESMFDAKLQYLRELIKLTELLGRQGQPQLVDKRIKRTLDSIEQDIGLAPEREV
ncbi:hypothetical protein ACFSR7_36390 [Cohnella sp. GCM10020058]|uniref:hypothetical protein n=1 Tax=Cohnella sp. GCM10020058 TaxID=3317330 RepID=UPI00362A6805